MRILVLEKELPGPLKAIILLSGCILFTLILFCFDEGRMSLEGILDGGNPGAILFYLLPMLSLSIAFYFIFKRSSGSTAAAIISALAGPPAGFALIIGLFWCLRVILRFY